MNNATLAAEEQEKEFLSSKISADELEEECAKTKSQVYAPLPLQRLTTPPKPYPFEALGKVAGAAARRMHEVVQAPDATCGQSVLAALSLACQGFIDVYIDGRVYPTSLYMLTICESGERKTGADKVALKSINDWQRYQIEQHKKLLIEYRNKYEIWKIRHQIQIKGIAESSGNSLKDLEPEPQQPCEGLLLCEEPTLEGLEQLLERGQPSAGVFADEGGRIVGGHAMNSENALKTACGLSNLWDGKPLTRVRKSEGSKIQYGRRLSMHLMIQPIVLKQLIDNKTLMGQGLLSRCLFSAPLPLAGTRRYQEVDLSRDPVIQAYYDLLNRILDNPYPKKKSPSDNDNIFRPGDSLEPKQIQLDHEAKSRWIEFHNMTDSKMKEDGEYYPIKPFASKASEQVLRIAGILAFSDRVFELSTEVEINIECLERAITLVLYYLEEVLRILENSGVDPDLFLAQQTLEWIKRHRRVQVFAIADVYQRGPNPIRCAKKAKKIMSILKMHHLVEEIADALIGGKRVRSAWRLIEGKSDI